MNGIVDYLGMIQILILIPISLPIIYWIRMKIRVSKIEFPEEGKISGPEICVILPMKNEMGNVERKLSSVISEILPFESVDLIVVDSNSGDGTRQIALEFLKSSELARARWKVENFETPGKNIALNGVIDGLQTDIIVISDADANVSPGWLSILVSRLEEEEVGVVSGIEKEVDSGAGDFSSYYRKKSNWLRISESNRDSTPVLEGSLLAWKTASLDSFRFNEDANADDAQIGLGSIRRGFRSIVDSRITFEDFERKERTFGESVRRAQGLSIALIKNADLAIINSRKNSRGAIFNAIALYVFFPWSALLFATNAIIAFSINPEIGHSWEFYSICTIFLTYLTPQGRSLAMGSAISIISHVQAIMGKRYRNWEPVR